MPPEFRATLRRLRRPRRVVDRALAAEIIEQLPEEFTFFAVGSSMLPAIKSGSRLRVVRAPIESVRPGDIVLVIGDSGPIAHRVVQGADGLLLWGDARRLPDGTLTSFRWVGRVTEVDPPSWRGVIRNLASRARRWLLPS